eukprot:CAMPEP_0178951688 /NCGR_PEP_ID=MMETSP0789-20121207/7372_1 /TAXON_ID=3005 /ORGANISM="Rhizosolenia setigera, Strain CCMP 1694" /LENGTH=242 /DNA_ID=CAMNT_0020632603 /DNA_START=130 /DNA_END=854 /DNA_ORIENTATION=-
MKAADSTTVMNNNETKQTHHHYNQSEKHETPMTTITTTSPTPFISLSTNNNNTTTNHNNKNRNEMYYVSINNIVKKETELFLNLGLMNHPGAQEMGIKHQKQRKQQKQLNKQQQRNRIIKKEDDSTASTTSSTNNSEYDCECNCVTSNSHSGDHNDNRRIGETNHNYFSTSSLLLSNEKKKSVQFCEPLITRMKIIDDEEECESSLLYYSEADYEEFRRNAIMDEYHCNDDSTATDKDGTIA